VSTVPLTVTVKVIVCDTFTSDELVGEGELVGGGGEFVGGGCGELGDSTVHWSWYCSLSKPPM
jgi:hypothetical protein